ncbi:hypothetical protein RHGRI_025575 [Rhododendron griersonianum]|uniref:Uncharacterized protein n=1 Tax=Rhododendron griersonianum TaxID=479676 RepID=A0AAV6IU60_9ERIC|nr:hypothetical protein RHGRI_025575 [Rhododendron griersonianum]KAG5530654.1 hypothetical protein RHGRI_025575 [Rhododendron griersonianum]KAG5530655.1 hypothetical protein RHGRI_025575 [Rhododendron griersonianum]
MPNHSRNMSSSISVPVFYQFQCLDASFYYPILSPLKRVASGKSIKDLQRIRFLSFTVLSFNYLVSLMCFTGLQVLWTGGCDMEIGGLNSDKSGIACSFRPGVRGIRWALEEVDAEPIGRLFWTVVGPVPTLDACFVLCFDFSCIFRPSSYKWAILVQF